MCRGIHCFMSMEGHGRRFNSLAELMELAAQAAGKANDQPQTHEAFIAAALQEAETKIRGYEIASSVLKGTPPEDGARLVALDVRVPFDPQKHGIASLATYELANKAFLVIGTDHLTQDKVSHMTPNIHGLEGLQKAVLIELDKKSVAAAEAEPQPG